jgi:hypothetical protein
MRRKMSHLGREGGREGREGLRSGLSTSLLYDRKFCYLKEMKRHRRKTGKRNASYFQITLEVLT